MFVWDAYAMGASVFFSILLISICVTKAEAPSAMGKASHKSHTGAPPAVTICEKRSSSGIMNIICLSAAEKSADMPLPSDWNTP